MFLDEEDIRRAFEEDEFFPLFQPQVELSTGRLNGFEVLARWNHVLLGAIPPSAFIPLVQKSGFINALTQKLLAKIFAAAPMLPAPLMLSVNLSPLQLLDMSIPMRIANAAERNGFPMERLTIEMTESALVEDLPRVQAVACEMKSLHCRLSLDDFGTGHSSLFHLLDLPFDELKVDRSFIHVMTQSRAGRKIVASLINLGRSMGLATVAEGVETEEQAGILNDLGCELAQGWLFGKAEPVSEIPRMIFAAEECDTERYAAV
ncbi:MAG: EAL domain-containing protein [Terracidiphilus sp.]|jgi:EAL domain-containing protein (putative c-di-GMP-specific phosphodiesterase class I)